MTDYSPAAALARSFGAQPKADVEARLKAVVSEPWTQADGYAAVDARSKGMCECPRPCGLRANVHHHIEGRGCTDPHRPDNLLHLADACHRDVHDHPERSYDEGTMRRRVR